MAGLGTEGAPMTTESPSEFTFTVRGVPKPQPRPKAQIRYARGKPVPHIYTPATGCAEWRSAVASAGQRAMPEPFAGPIEVEIIVYLVRPQRLCRPSDDPGIIRVDAAVGDADNFAKAILDALHDVAFRNDAQVSDLIVRKRYAAVGCSPGARICVRQVEAVGGLFS